MYSTDQSNVIVKSNVTLKQRGAVSPIDNMPNQYFDIRLSNILTQEQSIMKEKMHYWADKVYDEKKNLVEDKCYKGCQNCCEYNNHCKRPQNKINPNNCANK